VTPIARARNRKLVSCGLGLGDPLASSSPSVLVDETAEDVAALDVAEEIGQGSWSRRLEPNPPMKTSLCMPKTSSGPIDLDFCCRDTDDEDGAWL
jgi:hypothetical protein